MQVYLGVIDRELLAREIANSIITHVVESGEHDGLDYSDLEDVRERMEGHADYMLSRYGLTVDLEPDMWDGVEDDLYDMVNCEVEDIKERNN